MCKMLLRLVMNGMVSSFRCYIYGSYIDHLQLPQKTKTIPNELHVRYQDETAHE